MNWTKFSSTGLVIFGALNVAFCTLLGEEVSCMFQFYNWIIIFWVVQLVPLLVLGCESNIEFRIRKSLMCYYIIFTTVWGMTGYSAYAKECDSDGVIPCIPYSSVISYLLLIYMTASFAPIMYLMGLICLKCCLGRRLGFSNLNQSFVPIPRVTSIDIMSKFDRTATESDKEVECAVCCESISTGDKLVELPCSHRFHTECMKRWVEMNPICPCCRTNLS